MASRNRLRVSWKKVVKTVTAPSRTRKGRTQQKADADDEEELFLFLFLFFDPFYSMGAESYLRIYM